MWSCTEHALRDHSVAHLTVVLQSQLQMTSVSIGEHSNNRWSGMGTPPEVLAKSSNVETWFEHVELYFRAAGITPERRAAIVQYHADAEVRGVMKAMQIQDTDNYDSLKSALFKAFRVHTVQIPSRCLHQNQNY
ncbi:hypothetical protein T01_11748 [Trichinella spiralis]|uniref:Uncharacterized protein n=1 Tax=Trichinella spiralis TaxID=6334 RepID=A0A0V1BP49_TRISP|nr:hypothetical protein T01_11748 [Trichinella spiralis]